MDKKIQEVLAGCTVFGNGLRLPNVTLGRSDYLQVKKVMESHGGKWKGGKFAGFVFDHEPVDILQMFKDGDVSDKKKDYQFYATPVWVADMMVNDLYLLPEHKILEPSAGSGRLVEAVHRDVPCVVVDCYELNEHFYQYLGVCQGVNMCGRDFMESPDTEDYDRIIANPPFKNNQDIEHVMKMYGRLKSGGRMAVITSTHWTFAEDRKSVEFREWLQGKCKHKQELPEGSFRESGTSVATMYLIIEKE